MKGGTKAVRNAKDLLEKNLLNKPEVFCDVINNLLMKGIGTLKPEDLSEMNIWSSHIDADGEHREYYRDVLKVWDDHRTGMVLLGIENKTDPDESVFLKIPGYDSSLLNRQLEKGKISGKVTPVITIVLYYGYRKWKTPADFRSWKRVRSMPEEMWHCCTNYRYNVIDLGELTKEEVSLLNSDFRVIADYCSQMRRTGKYVPEPWTLDHANEVFELLRVMTGTTEFMELEKTEWKKGEFNMTSYPIGPVEKMRRRERKLADELKKKDEELKKKDEELRKMTEELRKKEEELIRVRVMSASSSG